jgi:hypothetical protein
LFEIVFQTIVPVLRKTNRKKTFTGANLATTPEFTTGANPTIASYNASVVKIYSATNSMARFYNKIIFL